MAVWADAGIARDGHILPSEVALNWFLFAAFSAHCGRSARRGCDNSHTVNAEYC